MAGKWEGVEAVRGREVRRRAKAKPVIQMNYW
jgi:hypothetical protein